MITGKDKRAALEGICHGDTPPITKLAVSDWFADQAAAPTTDHAGWISNTP